MKWFNDCLPLERIDSVRIGSCWSDDESDDGHVRVGFLETEVKTSEGFNEHVYRFVPVLVRACCEHLPYIVRFRGRCG
jgi:hypothetical protein